MRKTLESFTDIRRTLIVVSAGDNKRAMKIGSNITFYLKLPHQLWSPHILLFCGFRRLVPVLNWLEREVHCLLPSGVGIKNPGAIPLSHEPSSLA